MAIDTESFSEALPRLAHYAIRERLGHGGMGVVYRAWDLTLEREVALKVLPGRLHLEPARRARFLREARAAARLNHPNIATVYEVGDAEMPTGGLDPEPRDEPHVLVRSPVAETVLYIAMELVPGQDLEERLAAGPVPEAEAVDLALQIADGLEAAHGAGVVHRDLKPHNLRVTPDGRVKILDFGLAKVLRESSAPTSESAESDESNESTGPEDPTAFLTQEGMILGTAPYMSPEQVQGGPLDARSDLFSLGVILYRVVGGELPFESGSLVRYVRSLVNTEPKALSQLRPGVSSLFEGVVSRLLAKDPDERYASAARVRADLEAVADVVGRERPRVRYVDVPSSPDPTPSGISGGRRPSWGRRTLRRRLSRRKRHAWRKRLMWVSALAAIAAVALGAWWLTARQGALAVTNVAVLPFENQTRDPGLDAYYEGISAALIRKLSRVPGVNVVSELDVRRYRNTEKSLEQIARELNVGTMIMGYVQQEDDDTIVVDVQSQSTQPEVSLWQKDFRGSAGNLLRIQANIVDYVLRNLPVSVSRRERRLLGRNPTESRRAWDAYFRGTALLDQVDEPEQLERAVTQFQGAIEADPSFAWAYSALSEALWRLFRKRQQAELLSRAAASAEKAVELDPETPETWVARARVLRAQGRYEESLADLDQALRLNPLLDSAHRERAITAWDDGDAESADESFQRALEIRPTYWSHWNEYGAFLMETSRFPEAESALLEARRLAPEGVGRPLENLGSLALSRGDTSGALEHFEQVPAEEREPHLLYNMAVLHVFEGDLRQALEVLDEAVAQRPAEPTYRTVAGDLHLQLGEPVQAEREYARALADVEARLRTIRNDTNLQALRTYLLARNRRCEAAQRTAVTLQEDGDLPSELDIYLARAFVVCDQAERAERILDQLRAEGVPAERLRSEFELADLV
jgi:eukaryotic-like serine/threonine-protein kinase